MLSRREKLLQHPWCEKRYENHRRKVLSALPAIDNSSPEKRIHVAVKHKKLKKEDERSAKIERDNLLLLQKLNWIMSIKGVDNKWIEPLPNFLRRVTIYDLKKQHDNMNSTKTPDVKIPMKCYARESKKDNNVKKKLESEERIPSKPPSNSKNRRSQSVPPSNKDCQMTLLPFKNLKPASAPLQTQPITISLKEKSKVEQNNKNSNIRTSFRGSCDNVRDKITIKNGVGIKGIINTNNSGNERAKKKTRNDKLIKMLEEKNLKPTNNGLVLKSGCLILSLNFPTDTCVALRDGLKEKIIIKGFCACRNNIKINN